ncbi:serine/threonine protein kinase [Paenibacillus piri]|uniref:serine/threonine protein kinase n=1 Tax=Paenibacillus piri TaxID=2547395 RepID=UPI0015F2CB76|nr:serine/threonine-protein kinase [Paenibacillus piri]
MIEQQMGKFPGDVLGGRYRIAAVLGRGGTSTVYVADDLRLSGKRRAVKETRPAEQEAYASRAEAEMLIRLNHPNLPDIVDYYPSDERGFSYLVMDYIEGETLLQRFERQARRMTEGQVIGYALQLCDLFHYLHSYRPDPIIYRDLKPSNLMIDIEERVRLIDFGIARSFKAGQPSDTVQIGTVGFAAPEQFEGRQTDARTDLYGLGALMYFLLSGGHYYRAAYKRLREHDARLSASIAALVEKLLQAEPDARCQSAAEVRAELQRALAEQQAQSGAAEGAERRAPGLGAAQRGPARAGTAAGNAAAGLAPPRVIAVGALYAGAGATFAALAIARALHGLGVPHAVLEPPGRQPELYALLYGEKHAPAGYRCYNDAGLRHQPEAPWTDGRTLWLPAHPSASASPLVAPDAADSFRSGSGSSAGGLNNADGSSLAVQAEAAPPDISGAGRIADAPAAAAYGQTPYGLAGGADIDSPAGSRISPGAAYWPELFGSLERPVVVVDVGSDWLEHEAGGLLAAATDFVYVVDPLIHKLELGTVRRNLRLLDDLRSAGRPVHAIANKAVASGNTGQWLRILPETPVCLLPAIEQSKLAEASWLGILAQDRPGVKQRLNRALLPWLHIWLQPAAAEGKIAGPGTKRMLHKLMNNG